MTATQIHYVKSYHTETNTDVSKRIEDGRTIAFLTIEKAQKYAERIRSYVYELRCIVQMPGKAETEMIYGFAVPK